MAAFTGSSFLSLGTANSNAPRVWTYKTADSHANMVASGYFNSAVDYGVGVNDIILAIGATGGTETFSTIVVDAISGAGVVTTLSTVQTLA
jgi:hypothetical protein